MFVVALVVVLHLPGGDGKPVIYQERMASILECAAAVREMASRAPDELRQGGQLEVSCVVNVPKSENP